MTPSAAQIVFWPRALKAYVGLHCVWFALYALLGKGFAYAGWQPFYVGEFLLLLAFPAIFATGRVSALLRSPIGAILAAFIAWEVACMAPYLNTYGADALRDGVIWGYSAFGVVIAALMIKLPRSVEITITRYRRFARVFLFLGPAAWLVTIYLRDWLPVWPGTNVSVPLVKGGDYDVHLAGVFAFSQQGFGGWQTWWTLAVIGGAALGMTSRGGLVAFLVACAFSLLVRPNTGRTVTIVGVGLILVLLMSALDVTFTPPGAPRELSLNVVAESLSSIVNESNRTDLEGTKAWRLAWWRSIWNYTVNGPFFWLGKGYGINLADSDGFQVGTREEPLRSPHNSHLTFLARSGVPGFLLWISLQTVWAISMMRSYFAAKRAGIPWFGVFGWVLAYWIAFVVEAAFDVSLEGPMSGIPFWTIFGIGWGSHLLCKSMIERSQTNARVARA